MLQAPLFDDVFGDAFGVGGICGVIDDNLDFPTALFQGVVTADNDVQESLEFRHVIDLVGAFEIGVDAIGYACVLPVLLDVFPNQSDGFVAEGEIIHDGGVVRDEAIAGADELVGGDVVLAEEIIVDEADVFQVVVGDVRDILCKMRF